jgi:hypothetical protein
VLVVEETVFVTPNESDPKGVEEELAESSGVFDGQSEADTVLESRNETVDL